MSDVKEVTHPYRLHWFMIPPALAQARDIAFAGMMESLATTLVAAVQALWISAFFEGKLDRLAKDEEEMKWQSMLATQWTRLRYRAGHGVKFPDFVFDAIPYVDMLFGRSGCAEPQEGKFLEGVD